MARSSNTSRSASKPSPQTIAVLPFHDISAVPSPTWAIGMTDAIQQWEANKQEFDSTH